MNPLEARAQLELHQLELASLRRSLRQFDTYSAPFVSLHGRQLLNFASNDYLGFASHPAVRQAAAQAASTYGAGATASRLLSGTLPPHSQLESAIAQFKQTQAALVFATGWQTAAGVLPAIAKPTDVILLDKLAHACLIDAARLSGATLRIFPHNNTRRLRELLEWAKKNHPDALLLIVTESVFSMDGDLAPLDEIVELKDHYDAVLLLDEAHAIGVLGPQGRGLAAELNLAHRIELHMGTLGKALGVAGGYIACSQTIADWLLNRARSFIFSTAPPPAQAAAALAALHLLQSPEGQQHIRHLASLRSLLPQLLAELPPSLLPSPPPTPLPSAIFPLILGSESRALLASQSLLDRGILAPAVRYPTVPRGKARLRISLSAAHSAEQLLSLTSTLQNLNLPPS